MIIKKLYKRKDVIITLVLLQIFLQLCSISIVFTDEILDVSTINKYIYIIFFLSLVLSVAMLFFAGKFTNLLTDEANYEIEKIKFEQTREVNRILREQRHDFLNHLQVVGGYAEMGNCLEIKRYLNELKGTMKYPQIGLNMPDENSYFLSTKLMYASELGIKVSTDIKNQIDFDQNACVDFVRIIGNLIDNAIYELKKVPLKDRELILKSKIVEDNFMYIIFNKGTIISDEIKEQIFDPGFTTKGKNGDGMGLHIVKEIIENKYFGKIELESSQEIEGTKFKCIIPRNSKKVKSA